jgi:hypothetical protein
MPKRDGAAIIVAVLVLVVAAIALLLIGRLERNWYLFIPVILGVGAWLIARQRSMGHPTRWGTTFFLVGCGVVLVIDLTPFLLTT